ncbi:AsnC family protein [Candidatus Woesearchaeota archaeon]|nr:AsnC family protein [Candidatus Woesearchaeota archaeon]
MVNHLDDVDKKIMQLRALSYKQDYIAKKLKISQSAVSQRINKIRLVTKDNKNPEKLFWNLMLGDGPMHLLKNALKK